MFDIFYIYVGDVYLLYRVTKAGFVEDKYMCDDQFGGPKQSTYAARGTMAARS